MGLFGIDTTPICVLDLGSHQVRVLIAVRSESGGLEVLGFGQRKSLGLSEGLIINSKSAEQSVADAIASAENLAGVKINRAYVTLNSKHIRSLTLTLEQQLGGQAVTAALRAQMQAAAETQASAHLPGRTPWAHLHTIPLGYRLDGSEPTEAPDGLYGFALEAKFHIVSAPLMAIENLRQCLNLNGLEVERFVLAPYASALSVLDSAQRQYGAGVVDLGGDTTSIALFNNFKLQQVAVLPFGAKDITRDVAQHFGFNEDRAEKLKVTQGNLAATLSPLDASHAATLFNAQGFEHAELNPIIEARTREILLAVQETLQSKAFARHHPQTLVLTGAGSQLKGLLAYAENLFHDRRVRLGSPQSLSGAPDLIATAGFAAVDGLLRYAAKVRTQTAPRSLRLPRAGLSPHHLPVVRRLFGK